MYPTNETERNNLSGPLPKEIAIPSLRTIKLNRNGISGELPKEIGGLEHLEYLSIERNQFTGNLFFDELFDLADTLKDLRVSNNNFGGSIPDISAFSGLRTLWVAHNNFSGDFPTSVTALTGLGKTK